MMKAIETTGTIDHDGQLTLDLPIKGAQSQRVRVIVLIPEVEEANQPALDIATPDEDSRETIAAGIREGWQEALSGQIKPISELWSRLDVE